MIASVIVNEVRLRAVSSVPVDLRQVLQVCRSSLFTYTSFILCAPS